MAEQSVTSVTYGRGVGEGAGSAGGGSGGGVGSAEWGRGVVQSVELRTNNSELELSVEDLSLAFLSANTLYIYIYICMHVFFNLFLSNN